MTIFINENISKPKLELIPNLPACLIMLAFSPPKWGIRKNATEPNQKIEKQIIEAPIFVKPLKINQIPKPKTKNELVILQVRIKIFLEMISIKGSFD